MFKIVFGTVFEIILDEMQQIYRIPFNVRNASEEICRIIRNEIYPEELSIERKNVLIPI